MYHDEKYRVYTRGTHEEIFDAVVIRLQDVFAESAFYSYANSVRTCIEILEMQGNSVPDRLREIADFFTDAANASGGADKKIPT